MKKLAKSPVGTGKVLVIKAKGGLGNRMLSAVTGLLLARLNGRTAFIDWRDGMYLPPGENLYPHLFEADGRDAVEEFDDCEEVAPAIWSGRMTMHPTNLVHQMFPNRHQDPFLYRKMSIDLQSGDPPDRVGVYWSYVPKLKRLKSRLSRCPDFAGRSEDEIMSAMLAECFRPVREVRDQVDTLFAGMQPPVIGVHIRFTDRKGPLPKILAKLDALKRDQPGATIFLATDSKEAQDAILARFPDVRTIDKALARDGAALHVASGEFSDPVVEARNALVDMLALSRCDWLLHSSHSTFSVTAALLGRIPQKRQVDVDRYNPKVKIKQFIQAWA